MSLREFRDCTDDQLLPGCTDEARVSAKQNSFKIGANMLWGASGGVDEGVFFHQLVDKLFLVIFCPFPTCRRFSLCFCPQAYKAVGRALEWDVLGVAEDEAAMAQYREEVGTLADRRWESLTFLMPEKQVSFLVL